MRPPTLLRTWANARGGWRPCNGASNTIRGEVPKRRERERESVPRKETCKHFRQMAARASWDSRYANEADQKQLAMKIRPKTKTTRTSGLRGESGTGVVGSSVGHTLGPPLWPSSLPGGTCRIIDAESSDRSWTQLLDKSWKNVRKGLL